MLNVDTAAAWERLCLLVDDDPQLWPAVRDALEEDEDPWEALLDGLDDAGALASLRADDSGMELADALAQLPRVFRLQPEFGGVNDTDDLDDAIALADEILSEEGWRLVGLPEDDGHSLVVVPADATTEIARVAGELGRTVTIFG
jgi:hypothetical protein